MREDLGRLLRAIRVASAPAMLALGTLGWLLLEAAGPRAAALGDERFAALSGDAFPTTWDGARHAFETSARTVAAPMASVVSAWVEAARSAREPRRFLWHAGRGLWALAVWSIVGAAICRIAAPALAGRDRPGLWRAFRDAVTRAPRLTGPPLSPWLAIGILGTLAALVGLLFRIPIVGDWLGGSVGIAAILLAVPIAWLGLATLAGWPLMTATVAVDDGDALEAVSRGYGYLIHRPARYAAGLFAGLGVGVVGWWIVGLVYRVVIDAAGLLLSLGAGRDVLAEPGPILGFWLEAARWVATGWLGSYAWTAITALYLGLRADVDGTPVDDVRSAWTSDPPAPPPSVKPGAVAEPAQAETGP